MTRSKVLKVILIVVVIILIGGAGTAAYYFYTKYKKVVENPNVITQEETQYLVERVSKLMSIPTDELPTIATVIDKEKLKDQPFFKNAENGDKVLIFTKAKKAVLYRQSSNKIIEVAPIAIDESKTQNPTGQQGTQTAEQAVKVVLYNGTETPGLAAPAEEKIKAGVQGVEIAGKDNAKKKDYTKTIVVDLSGKQGAKADEIAKVLGGEVGSLPDGEARPDADIVVFLAK